MPPERVHLTGLTKRFRRVVAVDGIDLDIAPGEFFSLLGPSGCGKTTTLRLIAGFERADEGEIRVGDMDMASTPPHRRPVNTVFQHYALFPHLSVADNVTFGLRFTDATSEDRQRRVGEALELVQLGDLGERMPAELSGGQQQRVALARALVLNPSVLLLDEPLGALDAKLRKTLQVELKALQERVGITFLYVTHDQEEALTMSDRLAVMDEGRIRQVGTPRDVYESPDHAFVADFLGAANMLDAEALGEDQEGRCRVRLHDHELHAGRGEGGIRGPVKLVIRPERVVIEERDGPVDRENRLPGVIERLVFQGAVTQILVQLAGGGQLQALVPNQGQQALPDAGTDVAAHLPAGALRALPVGDTEPAETVG
ncbi:MAG: ABC transporter ATP-binding protein [Egibacteraceae bacterium]